MKQNEVTASILKALGHPLRIAIARELLKGELCVSHIMGNLKISQANTSQHLGILWNNGIVKKRREGNLIYYSLSEPEKIRQIFKILEAKKERP